MSLLRGAVGLMVMVAVATTVSVLLGMIFGAFSPLLAGIALLGGVGAGAITWRYALPPGKPVRGWMAWGVLTAYALFALRGFCWLVFERDDHLSFLTVNNLGDLPLHIAFIRWLAGGAPFWPENPIYAGTGLHYPFGMDGFNALLLLSGVDLYRGLIGVGLVAAGVTAILLWRWGGAFAVAGFLFNGGLVTWRLGMGASLEQMQDAVAWKSIPLAMFLTQRGLLYAIPAGLALLWSWRERFLRQRRGIPVALEIILYGTMPLFHLHTFLFLSWMLAAWGTLAIAERKWEEVRRFAVLLAGAVIPATWLIWELTGGFSAGRAIHWKPGWMQGDGNALRFWLENFGVIPLLLLLLPFSRWGLPREGRREHAAMVIPAVALFLLGCFVMFAAWEWDNTKLFLWCYLAVLPSLWCMISRWMPVWRAAACVLLFTSGALSLAGGLRGNGYELARRSELDAIAEVTRDLPPQATFAAWPTYNHPLLLLGRKVVMGYDGHLMSYGIDYSHRRAALKHLMSGAPHWRDAARELGADYLFWGERERRYYGGEAPPAWRGELRLVAEGDWGTLYALPQGRE